MDKKVNIDIQVSPNEMKAVSADVVDIDYNNNYVFLTFVQTFGVGENKKAKVLTRNGVVMARVMLSWEHFSLLTSDITNFVKETRDKAEKISKKAIEFADNMTVTVVDDNNEQ